MSSATNTSDPKSLFSPYRLGDLDLANRLVMAPLTRNRATRGSDAPNALNVDYYRQRASAGLIITEAAQISRQGQGYVWTPGIYTDAQVEGWKAVTDAVHKAHGHIFLQAWHVGRISHNSIQENGAKPVGPTSVRAKAGTFIETGPTDVSEPQALTTDGIARIVRDYAVAAANTKRAGFDGIEIHAANGYLLDQFLKDGVNTRTDSYGGSVENRARLTLEVTDAILGVLPKTRVGIRISPVSPFNDAEDSRPEETFLYLVEQLNRRQIAYIHVIEGSTGGGRDNRAFDYAKIRKAFGGAYMANNGYSRAMAIDAVAQGHADLVAIGRPFIANPDLVERFRRDAPLNTPDQATFYGGGAKGYTDYPFLDQAQAAE